MPRSSANSNAAKKNGLEVRDAETTGTYLTDHLKRMCNNISLMSLLVY